MIIITKIIVQYKHIDKITVTTGWWCTFSWWLDLGLILWQLMNYNFSWRAIVSADRQTYHLMGNSIGWFGNSIGWWEIVSADGQFIWLMGRGLASAICYSVWLMSTPKTDGSGLKLIYIRPSKMMPIYMDRRGGGGNVKEACTLIGPVSTVPVLQGVCWWGKGGCYL